MQDIVLQAAVYNFAFLEQLCTHLFLLALYVSTNFMSIVSGISYFYLCSCSSYYYPTTTS